MAMVKRKRVLFISTVQPMGRVQAKFGLLMDHIHSSNYGLQYATRAYHADLIKSKVQIHGEITWMFENVKPDYVINHCYASPGTPYSYAKAYARQAGVPCITPAAFLKMRYVD